MKTIFSAVLMLVFFLFIGGAHAAQTCKSSIAVATPTSRFTLNGDGTVTDNTTGLMWKQCVEGLSGAGCAAGSASTMDWKAALDHAATHSFAGYSDWRLANIKELGSIVETACLSPAVNLAVFPNTPSSLVWSASPYAYGPNYAWLLNFSNGYDGALGTNGKNDALQVRLVRGGQ